MIDVLSHGAILGIGISKYFGINLSQSIILSNLLIAFVIIFVKEINEMLAVVSYICSAMGLILMYECGCYQTSYFSGDGALFDTFDMVFILLSMILVFGIFIIKRKVLLSTIFNKELAEIEGYNTKFVKVIAVFCVACLVSIAMKVVGLICCGSMFLIPSMATIGFKYKNAILMSSLISLFGVLMGILCQEFLNYAFRPSMVMAIISMTIIVKFTSKVMYKN
ncbi:ZnuABC transporter family protein [Candidatus Gromoviella agglomerans]|nr:ZnuABC transporter family protein [Candidatus Gromoviella agglomerans]